MPKQPETPHQREARLMIVLPNGEEFENRVGEDEVRIGSGALNDIRIADPEVSTSHALLAFYNDNYFILDEGSEGGTFVNGIQITKPKKLSNADVITIGKSQITFMSKLGAKALEARLANVTGVVPIPIIEAIVEKKKDKKDKKDKPAEVAGLAGAAPVSSVSEGDKKKKEAKDKKSKEDERVKAARVRAWGGIIATVLSVILTVAISLVVTRTGSNQPPAAGLFGSASASKKLASPSTIKTFTGGKYEASGVAAVPDANGVLFVDDSRPDLVFYLPVNELGEQDGPVKAIPLGVSVENPEGITQFGTQFMIVGSLSTQESNDAGGIATFTFDPATQTVSKVVVITGLRKFLFDNVPELKTWADKTSIEGGLNIEGIAADPDPSHPRVLLGLRGPLLNGRALVVPIRQIDRQAPFTIENLKLDEANAIQLNLDGQAIRDMEYDSRLRAFLIISGAPETEERITFTLWEWSGEADQGREDARPKMQTLLDKKMKPEGVAHLKIGKQEFIFIVGDSNSYVKIDYLTP